MRTRIFLSTLLLLAFSVLAPTPPARPQAPLDPQSLLGEWQGTWTFENDSGKVLTGAYGLTIERVEGDKVHGRGEILGARNTEFQFEGTLAGNRLRFDKGGKDGATELRVEGTRMFGASQGKVTREIALSKKR